MTIRARTDVTVDFGETLSSVAGRVVIDTTNDGVADASETGIGGVTITLSGTDVLGGTVSRTTTSAADGTYAFTSVSAGTCTVTETQPSAYDDGNDHVGTVNPLASARPRRIRSARLRSPWEDLPV